jgi:hypothetical protein
VFWQTALIAGQMWLGEVTRPRPRRIGFDDLKQTNGPSEVRPLEYAGGTVELIPPRIWYGDFTQRAVERDSHWTDFIWAAPLQFLLDVITVGYRYYCGEAFSLCYGPDAHVERVTIGERLMYQAAIGTDNAGGGFLIDDPQAWGGDQPPGEGGQYSWCDITRGNFTDPTNAYLESLLSTPPNRTPSLRGVSCLISRGRLTDASPAGFTESGYFAAGGVGFIPRFREWKVVIRRQPDNLQTGFHQVRGPGKSARRHMNPAETIYEWATSLEYGAQIPLDELNVASLQAAAETFYNEDNGWSGKIAVAGVQPLEVVNNIAAQVDGLFDPSPSLGWTLRLIRRDYSFGSLRILDQSTITAVDNFSPGTYDDTVNKVEVPCFDMDNNFVERKGLYTDPANQLIQDGRTVPQTQDYRGVGDLPTANALATRDGQALSVPRAVMSCDVMPTFGRLTYRGEALILEWESPSFSKVMRVLDITPGSPERGDYQLVMIEDQFATGFRVSGDVVGSGHDDPAAGLDIAPPSATWNEVEFPPDGLTFTLQLTNTNQFQATITGGITFGTYAPGGQYARIYVTEPEGVQTLSPLYLAPDDSNKATFTWPALAAGVYEFCVQTFSLRQVTNGVKVCAEIVVAELGSPSASPSSSVSPSVSPSLSPSASVSASPSPSASASASVSPSSSESPSTSASVSPSSSTSPSVSSSPSASVSPSASLSPSSSPSSSVSPSASAPISQRWYLPSSGAAAVSPAFSAAWHKTTDGDRLACTPIKGATAMTVKAATADATGGGRFILWRQYVSDPVEAQTISGTVKGQVYCQTNSGISNPTLAVTIYVVSNDGSTVRGTLLGISASQTTGDPPVFWDSGSLVNVENRQLKDSSDNTSLTLTPVVAQASDRLVIELGYRETGTSGSTVARAYFGDANATDAAENETDRNSATAASVRTPWVEFSNEIVLE